MKLSEMTNEQLEDEYHQYHEMVDNCCYGTKDLMWLHAIEKELDRRGAEVYTKKEVHFPEPEEIECEDCGKIFEGNPDKEDTCPDCLKKLIQGEQ